jgi:hypothetical protein
MCEASPPTQLFTIPESGNYTGCRINVSIPVFSEAIKLPPNVAANERRGT